MRSEILARQLARVASTLVLAVGAVVLAGWWLDMDLLQRGLIGRVHVLPNTAVAFMLAAASLWLQTLEPAGRGPALGRLLGILVLALGAATLAERLMQWDFAIDRLLFAERVARLPYRPIGRMATNSAVEFLLAGVALSSLDLRLRRRWRPAHWAATVGLGIAGLALIGYLYGAQPLYSIDAAAAMALASAVGFFVLQLGILLSRPDNPAIALLLSTDRSGMLSRRLVLAVGLVPLLLGWLEILARAERLISNEVAIATFVVVVIAILVSVSLHTASVLQHGDRARERTLEREAAARRDAEEANRAKDDFLAVMSHELRTPLNAIIGYGSLLAEGIPDAVTAPQRRQLDRIAASARHLLALIDEMLTLTRIDLGEERLTPSPHDVRSVVEEAAAMVMPEARAKGLEFNLSLPQDAVQIETDAQKLRQVVVNLLSNAVKFTDRGIVSLAVHGTPDRAMIVIEDSGIGIAPEHLDRVFDAFWQVERGPTRRAGGTGLGLHITRHLVRLLGGEVLVRSRPGEGSRFCIELPRVWWAAAAARGTPVHSASAPGSMASD